jgi:serine/threonine protein kinase
MRPTAVEFLVHLSLSAAVAAVSNFTAEDAEEDKNSRMSRSEHVPRTKSAENVAVPIRHQQVDKFSITGAQLDLQWRQLRNVEYLTDGGNSWIHTAVFNGKPVVVKTLKPECQDVALAINEIEGELGMFVLVYDLFVVLGGLWQDAHDVILLILSAAVHSRLNHPNIVSLFGAGSTSKGVRFVVLERLDGGTLTQMLGYDTRIRDRRRRFWRRKQFAYLDVLKYARSIASGMHYCHEEAIPGSVVLHRDLKPDNIGFTLDGTVKLLDFGLARLLENADAKSNEVYSMSGETGSLRYMSPGKSLLD